VRVEIPEVREAAEPLDSTLFPKWQLTRLLLTEPLCPRLRFDQIGAALFPVASA
jgi:hypothetical protein